MKKSQTKADYKRRKREVRRSSQQLSRIPKKKTKFRNGDIVKLKDGEDMGYVEFCRYGKVYVKWAGNCDYHLEDELVIVVR